MSWVGRDQSELVGRIRALCYAPTARDVATFQGNLAKDARVVGDDLLIAERDGLGIGTATAYPMTMRVRGGPVSCQGVAYVGTIKTHRRSSASATEAGVATGLMREALRRARERGQVVSALMPFRVSYYDHFGYGLVEHRALWTIPLSILPKGDCDGFTFLEGAASADRRACRQKMVEAGQCDIERSDGAWEHFTSQEDEGWTVADQKGGGAMASWAHFDQGKVGEKDHLKVFDLAFESPAALRRLLSFFGTLRDQYSAVQVLLPSDVPVNWWLREPQIPHRSMNHETASVQQTTRMQMRILDHAAFLGALHLPVERRGAMTIAIAETEGSISRIRMEIEEGRATASATSAEADVECTDRIWAAIASGDLSAWRAAEMGLIKVNRAGAVELMKVFSAGPAPFCTEYF